MKIYLIFVPPGGGEADYQLQLESNSIPQPGDYITIKRKGVDGTEDFIAKRSWWSLSLEKEDGVCKVDSVSVECEFALGPFSSENHKRNVQIYNIKNGKTLEFDDSTY
ncbi:hypothetical protein [Leptospira mayottensis]|uniref:Alpha/beta hydrolase n=1 Tax=Leptospira mayottensis TaxID=1137606 RepID=A0ABN5NXZ7_9LEPT|nr:hypothetical protein [Leptospira mayottensis]AXR66613.1 alpha/beta hydrolase [Leptospira mayottensis]AZQ04254.1 alpha/beta hydrolase [Leptospira mayottensis 200901116]TGN04345.1 alpha/beta hydrolase [Leptospira mayottensis]